MKKKKAFKDSVIDYYCLDTNTRLYITTGKKRVLPNRASDSFFRNCNKYFQENNVDPWFAQTILLIESPAQLKYSRVGAYGPFQIMKELQETWVLL